MKLLIDNADINEIKRLYDYYPVDGVTTNPSILSRTGRKPFDVLHEIRAFIAEDDLHVQVVASSFEGMVKDAERIVAELGKNTFIKVPAAGEGFKVMKYLSLNGFCVTGTAVYMPMQAYLAAKCGCSYVAPYVNRIDNLGYDGIETVKRIQEIFENNGFSTGVLAASFKNSMQVLHLCEYGIAASICAPDIFDNFVRNAQVEEAVWAFRKDFEKLNGDGMTMAKL